MFSKRLGSRATVVSCLSNAKPPFKIFSNFLNGLFQLDIIFYPVAEPRQNLKQLSHNLTKCFFAYEQQDAQWQSCMATRHNTILACNADGASFNYPVQNCNHKRQNYGLCLPGVPICWARKRLNPAAKTA